MTLTLRAVSLNDLPLTQPITAQFGAQGGTIGRADSNTMALPDPERHISRQQAEIRGTGGGYLIFNVGSANPITVGGQSLAQGQSLPLRDRDQVRIGGYLLEVSENTAEDTNMMLAPRQAAPAAGLGPAVSASPASSGWPSSLATPSPAPAPFPASANAGFGAAPVSDPFADLMGGGGGSSSNPFADLLGGPPPPAAPRSAFAETHKAAPVAAPAPALGMLPDDFDPFAPPPPPAMAPPAASSGGFGGFGGLGAPVASPPPLARGNNDFGGPGAFGDLIPSTGAGPSSLDDMFGLKPAVSDAADPLAGFMAEAARAGGREGGDQFMSTDPMALFGDAPAVPKNTEPVTPALPDHTSALNASFRPPEVRRAQPPAADWDLPPAQTPVAAPVAPVAPAVQPQQIPQRQDVLPAFHAEPVVQSAPTFPADIATPMVMASETGATVSAPPAPRQAPRPAPAVPAQPVHAAASSAGGAGNADTAALWQAFCEGAGLRFDPPQGLNPDLMRIIGQLLRSSVEGTLQMMAVRAATKHELRAQVTVIRSRDNNPLKFSPDAQSALEQLLQPPVRGFLQGPAAMSDAMHDLVGHTIGTMAGTRAALEGVLGRFKPEMLESKLTSRSMLDSVLTLNRKAKLWELYLQHFESIRDEAQEDFHNLFGKAFLEAYEEQLERLNQRKSAA